MLLKELVENKMISLGRGQIISKDEINQFPGDYPVYSSSASETGEFGRYGKYMFDDERITWSIDGGGKMFYRNNHKYSVTNVCGWLKVNTPKLLTKYVYYCLFYQWSFRQFDYQYKAHPSIIKEIYDIPIIDVAKQKVIIETLDKVHDQISNEKESIPFLDSLIKSRFNELFMHRVLPIVRLVDISIAKGEYGAGSASAEYDPNRPRYVRITDINDDGTLNDDFVSSKVLIDDDEYKLSCGDFLFARMGATVGKTYAFYSGNQIYAGYLIRYKLDLNKINPRYLYWYTKQNEYWDWVKLKQSGAAQPGINAKKYDSLEIPLAPIKEQDEFASFVEQIDKLKFNCQQRIKLYQELLDKKMDEYFG